MISLDVEVRQYFDENSFKVALSAYANKAWKQIVIDSKNEEPNEFYRGSKLRLISKHYMNEGKAKQALEVAKAISHLSCKIEAFQYIASCLADVSRFDDAIKVAKMIPSQEYKDLKLVNLCKVMAEKGAVGKAHEAKDLILNDYYRSLAQKAINTYNA